MYAVSEKFLEAIQENTRSYEWYGNISGSNGTVYPFSEKDLVKGANSLTSQCCGSSELDIGGVYAAELNLSLYLDVDRYSMEGGKIELFFSIMTDEVNKETIPMGIFEISEANRSMHVLELKAYDYMLRFDKSFSLFTTNGSCYDFMNLCATSCNVELAQTKDEIGALINGNVNFAIYEENDIETYRDVLFYVAQILCGFFYINRAGKLEFKQFSETSLYEITQTKRFASSISDFKTRYTAISSSNVIDETAEYYSNTPDDGLTLNLGINPLLQYGLSESRASVCNRILGVISKVSFVPFDCEYIGNPALDIGDTILLSGGQMTSGGELCCITKRSIKICGKEKISGVGKNPRLASAKSKSDKNISALLKKTDSAALMLVMFSNAKTYTIGNEETMVLDMAFVVKNDCALEFQGQITLNCTPSDGSTVTISVTEYVDGIKVERPRPKETYIAGYHTMSLYYPIATASSNIVHEFEVCLKVEGGSVYVDLGEVLGCIRGLGTASAESSWNGRIAIEDTFPLYDVGGSLTVE